MSLFVLTSSLSIYFLSVRTQNNSYFSKFNDFFPLFYRLRIKTAPDPDLVRYYSHLQKLLSQGEEMSQKYRKMAESLNNAESTYQIKEAQVLRLQVMKAAETVQAVSKKIEQLPPDDAKCAKLQDRIRAAAMNFVKETLIGLPKTPTEQEFEEIKIQKAQEAAK